MNSKPLTVVIGLAAMLPGAHDACGRFCQPIASSVAENRSPRRWPLTDCIVNA